MQGGCHCGAVRYKIEGEAILSVLCNCLDCRQQSGAPVVAWGMFPDANVSILNGDVAIYSSSENGRR